MTKLESMLQTKHMKKKDERVELVTEVFNNVKVNIEYRLREGVGFPRQLSP